MPVAGRAGTTLAMRRPSDVTGRPASLWPGGRREALSLVPRPDTAAAAGVDTVARAIAGAAEPGRGPTARANGACGRRGVEAAAGTAITAPLTPPFSRGRG